MSWQKAAGSGDDAALSAIKRYVGGRACYHQFPRMCPLGNSVNKGLVRRLAIAGIQWPGIFLPVEPGLCLMVAGHLVL